jgi:FixJ family two-component response regulator
LRERIAGDRVEMPIIFITGHAGIPMTVKAMKAGAIEFLIKPSSHDALSSAIKNTLARRWPSRSSNHMAQRNVDRVVRP